MSTTKNAAPKIFSNQLKKLIAETGIKKNILAQNIGVSAGMISQLLTGTSGASPRTIKAIADQFKVNEEWLEYGTGEKDKQKTSSDSSNITLATATDIFIKLSNDGQNKALKAMLDILINEQQNR